MNFPQAWWRKYMCILYRHIENRLTTPETAHKHLSLICSRNDERPLTVSHNETRRFKILKTFSQFAKERQQTEKTSTPSGGGGGGGVNPFKIIPLHTSFFIHKNNNISLVVLPFDIFQYHRVNGWCLFALEPIATVTAPIINCLY